MTGGSEATVVTASTQGPGEKIAAALGARWPLHDLPLGPKQPHQAQ